jgi:hypothetical protein
MKVSTNIKAGSCYPYGELCYDDDDCCDGDCRMYCR